MLIINDQQKQISSVNNKQYIWYDHLRKAILSACPALD